MLAWLTVGDSQEAMQDPSGNENPESSGLLSYEQVSPH